MSSTQANCVREVAFRSARHRADPFHEVRLDVLVESPYGSQLRVPAFWAGDDTWRVRYASPEIGLHRYVTVCSDRQDPGLHGIEGDIEITAYTGSNPLLSHGPLVAEAAGRHFQHQDGEPFFWLGDTWWMGLCKRLRWPDEFAELTADRVEKGFNVVQIVGGLYPDMGWYDERGANEAGYPWAEDWSTVNPAYFDSADRRIAHLVDAGIVPCVVGAWGYYLPWTGAEVMKRHWRYLVARWGAYPVVWCVAGEANLPWYLAEGFPYDDRQAVSGWTEIAQYLRAVDPFHRLVSIHPTGLGRLSARGATDDQSTLDFDMLQTGHGDRDSLGPTVETVRWSYGAEPRMPVLNSEVNYEGILGRCDAGVQRLMFWACVLNGACGHTYGANGIWQMNGEDAPYGASPHGGTYGPTPWREAMRLPGSRHLGLAKRLLEAYPWSRFEPHPEWASYASDIAPRDEWHAPHCGGVPNEVRFVYAPQGHDLVVAGLGSGTWAAIAYDPAEMNPVSLGTLIADGDGLCRVRRPLADDPDRAEQDWLLVLRAG